VLWTAFEGYVVVAIVVGEGLSSHFRKSHCSLVAALCTSFPFFRFFRITRDTQLCLSEPNQNLNSHRSWNERKNLDLASVVVRNTTLLLPTVSLISEHIAC
jgi:hypothetical protein